MGSVAQYSSLADEYDTNDRTRLTHFVCSLKAASQALKFYQQLKSPTISWTAPLERFETWFHFETKRARASSEKRYIRFTQVHHRAGSRSEAFKNMLAEIERLACLVHKEEQTSYELCSILWWAVEGKE